MNRLQVSGVVLAAGPSRRFGTKLPKQLAVLEGEPLVRRAVRQVVEADLSEVIVVVGKAARRVRAAIEDLDVRIVHNPRYLEGQSTSVRAGLAALDPDATAAIFLPIDQPRLSSTLIRSLVDRHRQTGAAIVVPSFRGRRGAPVLIGKALFAELAAVEGDSGGRQLFAAHEEEIVELPLTDEAPLRDLDTLAELQELET